MVALSIQALLFLVEDFRLYFSAGCDNIQAKICDCMFFGMAVCGFSLLVKQFSQASAL